MKYHAQFLLDKERDKPDARLRFRVKWDGNIVAFNLGYRVVVSKWSKETQRCKINTTHGHKRISASVINREIQRYSDACENLFNQFDVIGKIPNKDEFRDEFNLRVKSESKIKIKNQKDFWEYFDEFITEEAKKYQWTDNTKSKYNRLKSLLFDYNENLSFDFFTEDKLLDLQLYFQNDLEYRNPTTHKKFTYLKRFFKWGLKKKYHKNDAFEFFRPVMVNTQKTVIFLTSEEIKKMMNLVFVEDKDNLEKVRDVFVFLCFTGLRYSDVANLKRIDVKDGYFEVNTQKTADNIKIELNEISKKILEKYKEEVYDKGLALPVASNPS